ncbi:enoyl-CoA hydratase/isomerase family protein [Gordonia sp. CPCC 206044]|uniref:enoyl-CoA hydratase/isomerase family protein n=1 Tax=Gordonia sp. CPCC 206044 TaxID=3140793 RepID=UPI003AF3C2DD
MSESGLVIRSHGDTVEICLDRAERRNALSLRMLAELERAVGGVPGHVRAVVLTAAGDVFCAGADFAELSGTSADLAYDDALGAAAAAIRTSTVPVLAAIEGPCLGAGVELAMSCDARICGPRAMFRVPAVELGLLYSPAAIRRLHAVVPRADLTRLLVFAEPFGLDDALRAGLATHIVGDDPREAALAMAAAVVTLPDDAVRSTRMLLRDLDDQIFDESSWRDVRIQVMDSGARRTAVDAARRKYVVGP